jgi:hypothetical protein
MGFAVEQVWRAKQGPKTIIRPYGDMAQSSALPTLMDVQSRFEFRGEKGRGALPHYKLERKLDRPIVVVDTAGRESTTRWVPISFRPDSLDAALNYAKDGPYRVLERCWDGSYVPLGTAEVNAVSRQPTTKTTGPVTGSGFKGKRKFW